MGQKPPQNPCRLNNDFTVHPSAPVKGIIAAVSAPDPQHQIGRHARDYSGKSAIDRRDRTVQKAFEE
jgi:hypothetical protein